MLQFSQNEKPQTNFHILQNNIVSTIAYTWGKKMHGYSFSRAKLEEKWEIRGTDYAQGNSYEDIFSAKWRLLCLLSFKHFLTHVKKCLRIAYRLLLEMFTFQCSLVRFYELTDMWLGKYSVTWLLDQSHASKNIWWIIRRNYGTRSMICKSHSPTGRSVLGKTVPNTDQPMLMNNNFLSYKLLCYTRIFSPENVQHLLAPFMSKDHLPPWTEVMLSAVLQLPVLVPVFVNFLKHRSGFGDLGEILKFPIFRPNVTFLRFSSVLKSAKSLWITRTPNLRSH